jgi:hypothetical protein
MLTEPINRLIIFVMVETCDLRISTSPDREIDSQWNNSKSENKTWYDL